jgi:hypothetical protein
MKRFRILLLVLTCCFATGSLQAPGSATKDFTYQAYDGPALAANQVAVLELQKPSRNLGFVSVDEKIVSRNWDGSLRESCKLNEYGGVRCKRIVTSIQLLPGPHTILFFILYGKGVSGPECVRNLYCTVTKNISLEAGKTYVAQANTPSRVVAQDTTITGRGRRVTTLESIEPGVEITEKPTR